MNFTEICTMITLVISSGISSVSKMYPNGIQFRNRSKVSRVDPTRAGFSEFSCKQITIFTADTILLMKISNNCLNNIS